MIFRLRDSNADTESFAVTANADDAPKEAEGGNVTERLAEGAIAKSTASPDPAFGSLAVTFTVAEQSRHKARFCASELRVKGGAVTVNATDAECVTLAEETALAVTVKLPAAEAVNATDTGLEVPTVNENEDGDAETLWGVCIVTWSVPVKPFIGAIDTATGPLAAPVVAETDVGETETVKSGVGGAGDDGEDAEELPPPPQPDTSSVNRSVPNAARPLIRSDMGFPPDQDLTWHQCARRLGGRQRPECSGAVQWTPYLVSAGTNTKLENRADQDRTSPRAGSNVTRYRRNSGLLEVS